MEYTMVELTDDLKANFRSWEIKSNSEDDIDLLANVLVRRHNVTYEMAYKAVRDFLGFD